MKAPKVPFSREKLIETDKKLFMLCGISLFIQCYSKHELVQFLCWLLDLILLVMSAVLICQNLKLDKKKRIRPYDFGFMRCWHPYYTLSLILSILFWFFPFSYVALIELIGQILFLGTFLVAFFVWLKK